MPVLSGPTGRPRRTPLPRFRAGRRFAVIATVLPLAALAIGATYTVAEGARVPGSAATEVAPARIEYRLPSPTPTAVAEVASVRGPADPSDDARVAAVSELLAGRPLEPYAPALVQAADRYGIDWRLMPVIAILESGAGIADCSYNAWGYASCAVGFSSYFEGIDRIASALAAPPYAGRSTEVILCIWVSGRGCDNALAAGYLAKAAGLYTRLGGSIATVAIPAIAPATPGAPTATATPSPTPTVEPPATPTAGEAGTEAGAGTPAASAIPTGAAEPPAPAD